MWDRAKRVIYRQNLMWLGGALDALCQSLIYGSSPCTPSRSASRAAAKSARVVHFHLFSSSIWMATCKGLLLCMPPCTTSNLWTFSA